MQNLLGIIYGAVFGIANIIPGVSGGTMLVTFGCYDRVCGALALDLKEIKRNIGFLIFFAIGAVIGIVGFSNLITLLFDRFPTAAYMFFIGLILGSVPLIVRSAAVREKFRPVCIIPFLIALGLVAGLTVLENNAGEAAEIDIAENGSVFSVTFTNNSGQDMEEWSLSVTGGAITEITSGDVEYVHQGGKTEAILSLFGVQPDDTPNRIVPKGDSVLKDGESIAFTAEAQGDLSLSASYSGKITPYFVITIVLASFLAAVAMIIPGVSGSFIMVLLGTYATVVSAVKDFNFAVLIPAAIGIILGLVLGARLIRLLLKRFRLTVFSVILGLCAGSVFAILPDGIGLNAQTGIGIAAAVLGAGISLVVGKMTKMSN